MEETAAYAIIAELDSANVSLLMGLTEISTGLVSPSQTQDKWAGVTTPERSGWRGVAA